MSTLPLHGWSSRSLSPPAGLLHVCHDRRRRRNRSHRRPCELQREENGRDGASSMVSKCSKVAAGEGETEKHRCDDGALMYNPMARVVLAVTLNIRDFPLCADCMSSSVNDPTDDGGDGDRNSDNIKINVNGSEGKSENNPCHGGVLMSMVMHGRRHNYAPIVRVVLAFALTTGDFRLPADATIAAIAAVSGRIVHMVVVAVPPQGEESAVVSEEARTTRAVGVYSCSRPCMAAGMITPPSRGWSWRLPLLPAAVV